MLIKHVDRLKYLLTVAGANGRPLNESRLIIWGKLFLITKNISDVELEYENVKSIENNNEVFCVTSNITKEISRKIKSSPRKLTSQESNMSSLAYEERYKIVEKDVMSHVKKWQSSK